MYYYIIGLIFAHFPSKSNVGLTEETSSASTKEGEETPGPEVAEDTAQSSGAKSYSELGDGQVMEILAKHLTGRGDECQLTDVNTKSSQTMDMVLFKGAIEHAARLCRSMVSEEKYIGDSVVVTMSLCMCVLQSLPGSHSLLIGTKGSGRRSLIRLMARVFSAKVFVNRHYSGFISDFKLRFG